MLNKLIVRPREGGAARLPPQTLPVNKGQTALPPPEPFTVSVLRYSANWLCIDYRGIQVTATQQSLHFVIPMSSVQADLVERTLHTLDRAFSHLPPETIFSNAQQMGHILVRADGGRLWKHTSSAERYLAHKLLPAALHETQMSTLVPFGTLLAERDDARQGLVVSDRHGRADIDEACVLCSTLVRRFGLKPVGFSWATVHMDKEEVPSVRAGASFCTADNSRTLSTEGWLQTQHELYRAEQGVERDASDAPTP